FVTHFPLVRCQPCPPLSPYTTLFRSILATAFEIRINAPPTRQVRSGPQPAFRETRGSVVFPGRRQRASPPQPLWSQARCSRTPPDRKSTRLNSSHVKTSYAVFCLKNR